MLSILRRVEARQDLTMEEMSQAIGTIMEGKWSEDQIGRFLLALHQQGGNGG